MDCMKFLSALFILALVGCSAPASQGNTAQPPATTPAPISSGKQGPVGEVSLTNDSRSDLPARTFSFGQVFRRGEVAVGDSVQATVSGQPLPTQIDAKALNPDGSVRHAIVTVALPEMHGRQTLKATLVNNLKKAAATTAPGDTVAPPALKVAITLDQGAGQKRVVELDLRSIVGADANKKPDFWLQGPLTQERRYVVDVDRRLQVLFDVYTPRTGPTRVDVIFCNDWNDLKGGEDYVVYGVAISDGGKPLFADQNIRQHPFSTWHYLAWSDGAAAPRTSPSLADLIAAGAVPRYDAKFHVGVKEREKVDDDARALTGKPLSPGSVTPYMPMTGGRFDIGPLPTWAVIDLLEGDAASRRLLLGNADAAGAVPWHIRERTTRLPLTTDRYPRLWLDTRGHEYAPLAEPFDGEKSTDWDMDDAHQPSLTYLPYLITGLRYYKDELAQQAAYVLLAYNDGYRDGAAGLVDGSLPETWFEQRRGISWSLRTLATAAYAIPNDDPLHGYFDAKLRGNLASLVNKYIVARRFKGAGPVEGYVPPIPTVATWQQGFFTITLGWVSAMGYSDADRMLNWTSNFLSGLFTSKAAGFDPIYGTSYVTVTSGPENKPVPLTSWQAVFDASDLRNQKQSTRDEYWDYYGMIMRAALASVQVADHGPKAKEAYAYVNKAVGGTEGDPTFAIVPP